MAWNPDTYNKFKEERFAPFYDLLQLIERKQHLTVIDLGCGTGELTKKLSDYLINADTLGIDASESMLKNAASFSRENIRFQCKTIEQQIETGAKWDLIFSNAALQWLEDHETLFPKLIRLINPGGQLVVQIPSNHDFFTHTTLQKLASTEPYRTAFNTWMRVSPVLSIEKYAAVLFDNGGTEIKVYQKVYAHVLKDANALYEWVSGTALIPYLEKLPADLQAGFITAYKSQLQSEFSQSPVFYPFKRTLMSAFF